MLTWDLESEKSMFESYLFYLLGCESYLFYLLSLRLNFCICKMEIEFRPQRSVRIHMCLIYTSAQQRCLFPQPLPKTRTQMSRYLNQVCYFPLHQPWDYNHVVMNDGKYLMYVLVEGGWWTRNTYELLFLISLNGSKLYLLITNGLSLLKTLR